MSAIGSKQPRFGTSRLSAWESFKAWRSARASAVGTYINMSSTAASGFAAASSSNITGQAELAAQMAVKRINAEAQAKIAESQAKLADAQKGLAVDKTA